MKALLKFLYFLLFLVIALLLAGLFLPKDIKIEAKTAIKAEPNLVFDQVNRLKNWENWSLWLNADSTLQIDYNEIPAGKGAVFQWKNNTDAGSAIIIESISNQDITMQIDFGEKGNADIFWKFVKDEGYTKVTWTFRDMHMDYFERYFLFLFKNSIQNDLKQSLKNLKAVCEDLRLSRISEMSIVELESQPAMIIIDSAAIDDIKAEKIKLYKRLKSYLDRRGIAITGNQFAISFKWNPEGTSTFGCGFPIAEKTWGWKEYTYFALPGGKAISFSHWGRYDSDKPYTALAKFIENNSLEQDGLFWEVYVKSIENEPDTSMWEKRIYYSLEPKEIE